MVAISSYLAESLQSRYGLRVPVRVQHDGIDAGMLLDSTEESHELIYAGSLQPWKGVTFAIEAMRLLPEFHLTVIGGEGKPLELLRRNAPGNVTFLGQLSRQALRPYLQKASIGLMPNLLEPRNALYTFPLKLLEYSAAGKGIVASGSRRSSGSISMVGRNWCRADRRRAIAAAVRTRMEKGIDRSAARTWAAQFLWEEQGRAMKQFLEAI